MKCRFGPALVQKHTCESSLDKLNGRQRAWRLQLSVLRDRLEYQSYADSKCLSKVTASFFPLQPHLLAVGLRA
jgi:hypothetical protein